MNHRRTILLVIVALMAPPVLLAKQNQKSEYVGEESRKIKSLSTDDISDLRNGRGWGLAKAAELNGIPGPAHLLELKDDIPLTDEQASRIRAVFEDMKSKAILQGEQLIELESRLDSAFGSGTITPDGLQVLLSRIADTHGDLRYIHLSAHLRMLPILSNDQIEKYNSLRGYSKDACAAVPFGHDPKMWREHNDCN